IYIAAVSEQKSKHRRIAISCRQHHHGFSSGPCFFRIAARLQKTFNDCWITVKASHCQRCNPIAILPVDVSACLEQQVDHFRIVVVDGPVDCGGAINLRRVDVKFSLQERAEAGFVARHHGIGNFAVMRGTDCDRNTEQSNSYRGESDQNLVNSEHSGDHTQELSRRYLFYSCVLDVGLSRFVSRSFSSQTYSMSRVFFSRLKSRSNVHGVLRKPGSSDATE